MRNLRKLSCCDSYSIRASYCSNRVFLICLIIIFQRNFCLKRTEHNWLSHHHIRSSRSVGKSFVFFTYLRDWSVKTELVCRNNFRKIVSIVSWTAAKWIGRLPCLFLLSWPLGTRVVARKIGHPLSANSINIFSARLSSFKEYHFLSEQGPINDNCPLPNFLAYKDTSRAFARHSCSLSLVPHEMCKGNVSCTSFTNIWLRQTAYILTHNMNNLEHIANNGTDTTKHTDVYNAQFWARRAPSVDAHVFTHRTCGSRSRLVCHSISSMHAHLCLVSWVVSPHPSLYFFQFLFQLYLMSIPAPDEISMEDPLCNSSLGSMVTLDYVTLLTGYEPQGHGAHGRRWAEPRDLQRYLLPEHLRRHSFHLQRPWRRRRWACRISCSCGR